MTKTTQQRIAKRLAAIVMGLENNGRSCGTQWLAARLAEALDEPGFDRAAFMTACDLTPEGWHK